MHTSFCGEVKLIDFKVDKRSLNKFPVSSSKQISPPCQ